jgi:hypothetical protein
VPPPNCASLLYATAMVCLAAGRQVEHTGGGIIHAISGSGQKSVADFCAIGEPQPEHRCGGIPLSAFNHPSTACSTLRSPREVCFGMMRW